MIITGSLSNRSSESIELLHNKQARLFSAMLAASAHCGGWVLAEVDLRPHQQKQAQLALAC